MPTIKQLKKDLSTANNEWSRLESRHLTARLRAKKALGAMKQAKSGSKVEASAARRYEKYTSQQLSLKRQIDSKKRKVESLKRQLRNKRERW